MNPCAAKAASTSSTSSITSSRQLLPLDESWLIGLVDAPWPIKKITEALDGSEATLRALAHEFLFISLFRACTESLARENAIRLAAKQRADQSNDELLEHHQDSSHRLRQSAIDEELFDVVSGFEASTEKKRPG